MKITFRTLGNAATAVTINFNKGIGTIGSGAFKEIQGHVVVNIADNGTTTTVEGTAFEDSAKWVVPLSPVTDAEAMRNRILAITAGGGTAFYSPIQMAYNALKAADAQYKHLIFLSDGEAADAGYMELVKRMAEEGEESTPPCRKT